jgi:hypothetical protein
MARLTSVHGALKLRRCSEDVELEWAEFETRENPKLLPHMIPLIWKYKYIVNVPHPRHHHLSNRIRCIAVACVLFQVFALDRAVWLLSLNPS